MVLTKLTLAEMQHRWPAFARFSKLMISQAELNLLQRVCSGHLADVQSAQTFGSTGKRTILFCFGGVDAPGQAERFFDRFSFRLQRFAIAEEAEIIIQVQTIPFVFKTDGQVARAIRSINHVDH
ncbi:MAG: hypothetical protein AAFW60_00315 [Pseudomonadota bacterium]